ncbi:iron-sulfur cluster-binding, Rieske family domain protein [Mycobacterium xenopi 3993]|nr:iron-sulfur cluster-binding, Rieske family domain protein [Mycobacterium xenopi 3993]
MARRCRSPEDTLNTIEIYWRGLGVSFNGEHTREGVRVISICATPVNETTSDIFAGYWIDDESSDFPQRLAAAKQALPQDIEIWNHQRYMDPPGLATSEAAGFKRLRAWARRFYPEADDRPQLAVAHGA